MTETQRKAILLIARTMAIANRREAVEEAVGYNEDKLDRLRERSAASYSALVEYLDSIVSKGEI